MALESFHNTFRDTQWRNVMQVWWSIHDLIPFISTVHWLLILLAKEAFSYARVMRFMFYFAFFFSFLFLVLFFLFPLSLFFLLHKFVPHLTGWAKSQIIFLWTFLPVVIPDLIFLRFLTERLGRDSSVGIGTGRSGVRTPVGVRFSAPVQTGPGAHPACYAMGNGSLSPGWGRSGRGVTTTHPI